MARELPDVGDIAAVLDTAARTLGRKAEIQKQIKALKAEELAIDRVLRATWGDRIDDMRGMMAALIRSIKLPEDEIPPVEVPVEPVEEPEPEPAPVEEG